MVRTINTHLSNFIPSCLLFYFFLCLYLILLCLRLFIPRLLSLCLSLWFVSFIFHSVFLPHSHISSLTSFPLSHCLITLCLH
jgi:hypothetical protein